MKETSLVEIEIEKLVYGGGGLARMDGQVVLLPYVLPGERVSFAPQRKKAGVIKGAHAQILQASPERISPKCEYFGACGGCQWQHAGYEYQVAQKVAILRETLRRIGNVDYSAEIATIYGEPWGYRNRVQLHFKSGAAGFHKAESHEVQKVRHCEIAAPLLNEAIASIHEAVRKPDWPDFLRSMELFTNGNQIQVNVLETNRPVAARFFVGLKQRLPAIEDGSLAYEAAGERFRISGGSFFQTNRFLIEALVNEVLAEESGEEAVDLYAGVGLFTLPMAKRFRRVLAVERGGSAFRDLEFNSQGRNVSAQRATAETFLRELQAAPEWMVADPPRAGLDKEVVTEILRLKPRRLTLVSCDPTTLARDLKTMLPGGYAIERMTLVDLFPQTYHFETLVRLRLQS